MTCLSIHSATCRYTQSNCWLPLVVVYSCSTHCKLTAIKAVSVGAHDFRWSCSSVPYVRYADCWLTSAPGRFLRSSTNSYTTGSWICFPCLAPFWLQRSSQTRSKREEERTIRIIYRCAQDMPYTSEIFLADLPTMTNRRHQLARKFFKSTTHPTSSLYNLLPLLGNIHLSLDYETLQNFLASPLEPKNTNHSSHSSLPLSDFIIVFSQCIYCFFVCVCLCPTILFSLWLLLSINV